MPGAACPPLKSQQRQASSRWWRAVHTCAASSTRSAPTRPTWPAGVGVVPSTVSLRAGVEASLRRGAVPPAPLRRDEVPSRVRDNSCQRRQSLTAGRAAENLNSDRRGTGAIPLPAYPTAPLTIRWPGWHQGEHTGGCFDSGSNFNCDTFRPKRTFLRISVLYWSSTGYGFL